MVDILLHPQSLLEMILPLLAIFAITLTFIHIRKMKNKSTKYDTEGQYYIEEITIREKDNILKRIVYQDNNYTNVVKEFIDNRMGIYEDRQEIESNKPKWTRIYNIGMKELHKD